MSSMQSADLDAKQLWFLILHFLSDSPVSHMLEPLERQLIQSKLLPGPASDEGEPYTYEELAAIHGHVPKCELAMLVQAGLRAQGYERKGMFTSAPTSRTAPVVSGLAKEPLLQHALRLREVGSFSGSMHSVVPTSAVFGKLRHQRTFRGHSAAVYALALDPLMRYVITGSDDYMIKIWSMVTGVVLAACRGHTAEITDIKINADAMRIASSSNDGSIRIWSLEQDNLGFPLAVLKARPDHAAGIGTTGGPGSSPALGALNRSSSATERRNVNGEAAAPVASGPAGVADANGVNDQSAANQFVINFLDWNPIVTNALAAVSSDGVCRVWDTVSGADPVELRPANAFGRPPFIPAGVGSALASGSASIGPVAPQAADGAGPSTAAASDAPSPVARISAGPDDTNFTLMCCAWSPCGTYLAATGNLHVGFLWHWPLRKIPTPSDAVSIRSLQKVPPTVRRRLKALWTVPRSVWPGIQDLCELAGHRAGVEIRSVRFSRGGERLATASADSTVRLYAPVSSTTLSPAASAQLAREPRSLDLDAPAQVWAQTLVMICQVYTPPTRPNTRRPRAQTAPEVQQIEWSLDDRRIMAATSDFTVRVFDTHGGTQLHVLHGHTKALYELAAHPRVPDVVASWAHDGTISVWDVSNGRQLAHFSAQNTFPGNGRWCDTEPICFLDGGWTATGDALMTTDVAGQFHTFAFGPAHLNGRAAYDQFYKNDYELITAGPDGFAVSVAAQRPTHLLSPPVCDYNLAPYENPYQDLAKCNALSQGVEIRDWKTGSCPPSVLGSFSPLAAAVEWNVIHRNSRNGELAAHNAMLRYSAAQDELLDRFRNGLETQPPVDPDIIYQPSSRPAAASVAPVIMAPPAARPRQNTHRIPSTVNPRDMVQISGGGDSDNDGAALSNDDSDQEYVQSEAEDEAALSADNHRAREPRRSSQGVRSRSHAMRPQQNYIDRRSDDDEGEYVNESSGDEPEISSDTDGEMMAEPKKGRRTARSRAQKKRDRAVLRSTSTSQESPASSPRQQQRRGRADAATRETARAAPDMATQQVKPMWRPDSCYAWLQECSASGAYYVPQVGDEVAYIIKLHEECEREHGAVTGDLGSRQLPQVSFRECEPCRVNTITYAIWPGEIPAQQFTVARVELVLLAPQRAGATGGASSSGRELKVTLDIPPPIAEFAEFVVPLQSYEDGCRRVHRVGDEVQTYMLGSDSRCQWYKGTVVSDTLDGQVVTDADLFVTDQIGRYKVEWEIRDDESSGDSDDMNPWELQSPGCSVDDLLEPFKGSRPEVLAACNRLETACSAVATWTLRHSSYDKPLRMLPECKFRPGVGHGGQRAWFTGSVPLPMSVGLIQSRAEGRWYRSVQQMVDDADMLIVNVARFYYDKNPINLDAHAICEFLRAAILDRPANDAAEGSDDSRGGQPMVGRRQLLSTVGEARSAPGRQNGASGSRLANASQVPVHVREQQADSGDSHDQRAPGADGRRQTRGNGHPIEADVQLSDRRQRRPERSAAEAADGGAEDFGDLGRRETRARTGGAAAEAPQRRATTRKRGRAAADSESEGEWEADGVDSDESLLDEDDSAGRRRGKASKRSRR